MSYDAAILKYNNPASLRNRMRLRLERAEREAEKAAERAERAMEREKMQKNLAEMAEELKRQGDTEKANEEK